MLGRMCKRCITTCKGGLTLIQEALWMRDLGAEYPYPRHLGHEDPIYMRPCINIVVNA